MRRFAFGFVASILAVAAITAAQAAFASSAARTTICHRTISAKKPYVKLSVSKSVLKGHLKHAADIIPAPAGPCPQVVLSPTGGGQALTTNLSGASEVPGPGDPDGAGTATIRLRLGEGRLCFQLSATNITLPAAAAHVHQGATGVAGSIVVTLKPPAANGTASGCVAVPRTLVAQILGGSSGYYVNVHTSDFPNGAIRGQL